jgi:hypothetical protein
MNINLRTTLGDVRESDLPAALGWCPTDSRVALRVNEAQQRLLNKGKWWGTVGKYQIAATSGIITLPREFAVIEQAAVCNDPVPVRDFWFEFIANGFGTRDEDNPHGYAEAVYRGRYPIITSLSGVGNKLRFKCDLAADEGTPVRIVGKDDSGNWIRSEESGTWVDGELITLTRTPGTLSVNGYTEITGIQFPGPASGQSWLYEETDAGVQTLIGNYQYNESRPSYARYFFPSIYNVAAGDTVLVQVLAKREYIPVVLDTDYLIVGNIPALKEMCQSIEIRRKATGQTDIVLAEAHEQKAVQLLEEELDHYLGSGRRIGAQVVGAGIGESDPIYNPL